MIEGLSSIITMPQEIPGEKFAMKRDQTNGFEVQLDINPNAHFNLGSTNYDTTKLYMLAYDEYNSASDVYTDCVIMVMLMQLKIR